MLGVSEDPRNGCLIRLALNQSSDKISEGEGAGHHFHLSFTSKVNSDSLFLSLYNTLPTYLSPYLQTPIVLLNSFPLQFVISESAMAAAEDTRRHGYSDEQRPRPPKKRFLASSSSSPSQSVDGDSDDSASDDGGKTLLVRQDPPWTLGNQSTDQGKQEPYEDFRRDAIFRQWKEYTVRHALSLSCSSDSYGLVAFSI